MLALSRIRGLGEAHLTSLIRTFGDLNAVWEAGEVALQGAFTAAGLRGTNTVLDQVRHKRAALRKAAQEDLDRYQQQGIRSSRAPNLRTPVNLSV